MKPWNSCIAPAYIPNKRSLALSHLVEEKTKSFHAGESLLYRISRSLVRLVGSEMCIRDSSTPASVHIRSLLTSVNNIAAAMDSDSLFWDAKPFIIDCRQVENAVSVIQHDPTKLILDEFRKLRCLPSPLITLETAAKNPEKLNLLSSICGELGSPITILVTSNELQYNQTYISLSDLHRALSSAGIQIVLFIDQGHMACANLRMRAFLERCEVCGDWKSIVVHGGSIPSSALPKGDATQRLIRRNERATWQHIEQSSFSYRGHLIYGDAGIRPPEPNFDAESGRLGRPKLLYTSTNHTIIFTDKRGSTGSYGQRYRSIASDVAKSKEWMDASFSIGDDSILKASQALRPPADSTSYIRMGFNHHFEVCIDELNGRLSDAQMAAE